MSSCRLVDGNVEVAINIKLTIRIAQGENFHEALLEAQPTGRVEVGPHLLRYTSSFLQQEDANRWLSSSPSASELQ